MYIQEILWLFSWPVFILISYYVIRYAIRKFEKKNKAEQVET